MAPTHESTFPLLLTLELLRSLESLLLFLLLCAEATSTDFSLLCDRDLEESRPEEESRSRELRLEDFSSFKKKRWH